MGLGAVSLALSWSAKALTACRHCPAFAGAWTPSPDCLDWNPSSNNHSSYVTLDLSLRFSDFRSLEYKMRMTMIFASGGQDRVPNEDQWVNIHKT